MRSLLLLGCFVIGMIIPEYLLRFQVGKRQGQIEHTLPDALDLLVICTNAGYSLATSLERTAIELSRMAPALADELTVAYRELQLSGEIAVTLQSMVAVVCRLA